MPRPPSSAVHPAVGIDLGTTHTVVAQHSQVHAIAPGAPRDTLLASVVAFPPSGGRLVGWAARDRRVIDPRNTLLSTKRLIGATMFSGRAKRFAERTAYEVVEGEGGRAAIRTRQGIVDPVDVAADLLRTACKGANRDLAEHAAVITVPAAFGAEERGATVEAARRAGFASAKLIEEPVATAIAYLSRSNLRYAAVYDLGGGTFDMAIVDCARFPFTVVGHAGDPYLGGDDVDRALATRIADRVLSTQRWDLASDAETFARLTASCEDVKIALSNGHTEVPLDLREVDPAGSFAQPTIEVAREELAQITSDVVRRTFVLCDLVLGEANLRARDIDAVFLAGGSTSLPNLREMVGQYFGKRARFDLDPMHVVAQGASTAAVRPNLSSLLESDGFAA